MKNSIAHLALFLISLSLFNGCKKNDDECPVCPSAVSIFPTSGTGGDTLTITGFNFAESAADNIVKINGQVVGLDSIISGTTTEIKVLVPENCGTGSVTVDLDGEIINKGTPPVFEYKNKYLVQEKWTMNNPQSIVFSKTQNGGTKYVLANNKIYKFNNSDYLEFYYQPIDTVNEHITEIAGGQNNEVFAIIFNNSVNKYMKVAKIAPSSPQPIQTNIYSTSPFAISGIVVYNNKVYVTHKDNKIIEIPSNSPSSVKEYEFTSNVLSTSETCRSLAVDNNGIFYLTKRSSHSIYKVTLNTPDYTCNLSNFVGSSSYGFSNGSGANAFFYTPRIVCDINNNIIVADCNNHSLRKVDLNGNVTTIAGSFSSIGCTTFEALGANASFTSPRGICIDDLGKIWIVDDGCDKIYSTSPR
jgi:hypothetical protein